MNRTQVVHGGGNDKTKTYMYVYTMITGYRLTHSSCHVVGRTVTGMPDPLSFLIASAKTRRGLFVDVFVYIQWYKMIHCTVF